MYVLDTKASFLRRPPLGHHLGLRPRGIARDQPGVLSQSQGPPDPHVVALPDSAFPDDRAESHLRETLCAELCGRPGLPGGQRNARYCKHHARTLTAQIMFDGLVLLVSL